jgi:hypothetical protein
MTAKLQVLRPREGASILGKLGLVESGDAAIAASQEKDT